MTNITKTPYSQAFFPHFSLYKMQTNPPILPFPFIDIIYITFRIDYSSVAKFELFSELYCNFIQQFFLNYIQRIPVVFYCVLHTLPHAKTRWSYAKHTPTGPYSFICGYSSSSRSISQATLTADATISAHFSACPSRFPNASCCSGSVKM